MAIESRVPINTVLLGSPHPKNRSSPALSPYNSQVVHCDLYGNSIVFAQILQYSRWILTRVEITRNGTIFQYRPRKILKSKSTTSTVRTKIAQRECLIKERAFKRTKSAGLRCAEMYWNSLSFQQVRPENFISRSAGREVVLDFWGAERGGWSPCSREGGRPVLGWSPCASAPHTVGSTGGLEGEGEREEGGAAACAAALRPSLPLRRPPLLRPTRAAPSERARERERQRRDRQTDRQAGRQTRARTERERARERELKRGWTRSLRCLSSTETADVS